MVHLWPLCLDQGFDLPVLRCSGLFPPGLYWERFLQPKNHALLCPWIELFPGPGFVTPPFRPSLELGPACAIPTPPLEDKEQGLGELLL